jgi:hypothetical protein
MMMDNTIEINERVEVIARYRTHGDPLAICWPAKMQFRGQVTTFTELGLRHPTTRGRRMIHVFDMSDGVNDYRLEFDAEMLTWTLIAMLPGLRHTDELQEELVRIAHNRRAAKKRGEGLS